jgi:two-component system phosphate regulon response regulator PhoB
MRATILLLEPDHDLNQLFKYLLQTEGYRVWALHRWEDAQLVLNANIPELIIFDWASTTTGSYQWAAQLWANPATAHIPLLLLGSDTPPPESPIWCASAGCVFIEKPVDLAVLHDQVQALLLPRAREVST